MEANSTKNAAPEEEISDQELEMKMEELQKEIAQIDQRIKGFSQSAGFSNVDSQEDLDEQKLSEMFIDFI